MECLEAEGVEYVFGIPGEETLDLSDALEASSIEFVPVRHEQGGAYMADVHGRVTGRAGVCLGTLGPGAANLTTAVADATLDHAPLVALTGQAELERMHKESHQHIDVVSLLRPITKWNARVAEPSTIPEMVRKAFKVAESSKPGATHLELPEDVMAARTAGRPLQRRPPPVPQPAERELVAAADLLARAEHPVVLAGNGVVRNGAAPALRELAEVTGVGVAETFMGKGVLDCDDPHGLGAVGLQAGDFDMAGFDRADVVLCVGFDLVEHDPALWNPDADKQLIVIDTVPAETDAHLQPDAELVGDLYHILGRLTAELRDTAHTPVSTRLRETVMGRFEAAADDPASPLQPPRVLWELRRVLDEEDVLISDVGLHKLWVGRMFPAHEPGTVMITNGLAGMGFAVPAAVATRLLRPDRTVIAVCGDGGLMMNVQELETATRLGTPFVTVVWEDRQFGSIVWKQEQAFGRHMGTDFDNPDFVALAGSFGMPAWRVTDADALADRLEHAVGLDEPSLISLPIDYSPDVAITPELGEGIIPT